MILQVPIYADSVDIYSPDYQKLRQWIAILELRNAVKARDLVLLSQLVAESKKKKLEREIANDVKTAEDVIARLEAIKRLTQMIADMDRQLVAEVKSYLNPRPPVYNVIAATFMLLGEPKANIKVECKYVN